ncbi:MAG TPA: nitronate monooxygenase [Geobacteraceae bacterium]
MTDLRELLGIELPIIQAPMAGVQGRALAVAVSEAGGLGSLPCAMLSPAAMAAELAAITRETRAPINVNFFCHTPPAPNPQREAAWREALAPYYREFGIDADSPAPGPARTPFDAVVADTLEGVTPAVVSFHFGLPAAELLERVKTWGAKVFATATTVEEALWLEARGADAVIAQGFEAGGHRGMFLTRDLTTQTGTLALVPRVVHSRSSGSTVWTSRRGSSIVPSCPAAHSPPCCAGMPCWPG